MKAPQAHNCNEAAECGLERKRTTTTAGCLQEDYYYRMSLLERTITTGCILINGRSSRQQIEGDGSSETESSYNLEPWDCETHTHMHRNKRIEISENQNSRNSNYWIQSFLLTKYMKVTSTDNSGFECFFWFFQCFLHPGESNSLFSNLQTESPMDSPPIISVSCITMVKTPLVQDECW